MAVTGFGSGLSSNFSSSRNLDSDSLNKFLDLFKSTPQNPPTEKLTQVLGESTNSLAITFQQIISVIPSYFFILLGLEIFFLATLVIVISLISRAWSNASLIQSIQTAFNDQKPTIRDSSEKAFSALKSLIWLDIVPTLIFFLVTLVVFGLLITGIIFGRGIEILFIILMIIAVLILIYAFIMLDLTRIWALRIAVLDKLSGSVSFTKGFKLARKKFWSMLLLGLVNLILTGLIIGLPVTIMIGLMLGGIFSFRNSLSLAIVLLFLGGNELPRSRAARYQTSPSNRAN